MPRSLPTTYYELLDQLPARALTARRRGATHRLMDARDTYLAAEEALQVAVREAYDAGDSWQTIGTILGITRHAAQRRFRRPTEKGDELAED